MVHAIASSLIIPTNARDLLFPVADCNISVSPNKSLRQTASPRYNVRVESHAQAPTAAPIFLPSPCRSGATYGSNSESRTPASLSLSKACTLLKTARLQPIDSQPLAHSFKTIGGCGVNHPFPFWERHPVAAIASQIAGLSPKSWRDHPRETYLSPESRHHDNRRTPSRPDPSANPIHNPKQRPSHLTRFSLAIKKQSIPNLPPIAGNERKANNVYKVFRTAVLFFRRIDR
jgi:hypothetical protein